MGTTYDLIPCLGGESPHAAVAREYGEDNVNDVLAEFGVDPISTEEHPPQEFARWRENVLSRLLEVEGWTREDDPNGTVVLFSDRWGWQVEVNAQDVTLRWRKSPGADELSDYEVLMLFNDTPCVLVFPSIFEYGWVPLWEIAEGFSL